MFHRRRGDSARPLLLALAALAPALVAATSEPQSQPTPERDGSSQPASGPSEEDDAQALERAFAEEMAASAVETPAATTAQPPPTPRQDPATAAALGLSNLLNPAISGIAMLMAGGALRPDEVPAVDGDLPVGLSLQEIEVRLSAMVDPYFRADLTLAGNAEEIGFEEAFVTTTWIPLLTLRAGQMHAALGRHCGLHTHAYPFLTAPLPWRELLGAEGLKDPGLSADLLLPLPFFAELNLQVFQGEWRPLEGGPVATAGADDEVDLRADHDLAYLVHARTLAELGDAATLELGGSYLGGRNGLGGLTSLVGADLTLKWRPPTAERDTGLEWTTEALWQHREGASADLDRAGIYSSLRYQLLRWWWLQGRASVLGWPVADAPRRWRGELLVALVPSEFSALRLQYAVDVDAQRWPAQAHELFLQAIFAIGPHPAHAY